MNNYIYANWENGASGKEVRSALESGFNHITNQIANLNKEVQNYKDNKYIQFKKIVLNNFVSNTELKCYNQSFDIDDATEIASIVFINADGNKIELGCKTRGNTVIVYSDTIPFDTIYCLVGYYE